MRKLWGFSGALRWPARTAADGQFGPAALPRQLVLPLSQYGHATPVTPLVKPGEQVLKGQCLARADDDLGGTVHAPSSGVITAIEPRVFPHIHAIPLPSMILSTDGLERWTTLPASLSEYRQIAPIQLLQRIAEAGIVGLGGGIFPTAAKLSAQSIRLVILNGAECEPGLNSDEVLMQQRPQAVLQGLQIVQHIVQAPQAIVALKDGKTAVQLSAAVDDLNTQGSIRVQTIPAEYPSGAERQLIHILIGRELPSGSRPTDLGIVCLNVATAAAVYDAVCHARPLISRYVTVAGEGVAQSRVLEVLLGTSVAELIAQCGGYTTAAEQLIVGGLMMGTAVADDDIPITQNCTGIMVKAAAAEQAVMPCIRCGVCVDVCPARLLPQQLYHYAQQKDFEQTQQQHLFDCIECGCCAAVCPSHIPLVDYYRYAKSAIKTQQYQQAQAEAARARYESRQQRLAAEQQQQAEQRQKHNQQDAKQMAVQAALRRARAKRRARHVPMND